MGSLRGKVSARKRKAIGSRITHERGNNKRERRRKHVTETRVVNAPETLKTASRNVFAHSRYATFLL